MLDLHVCLCCHCIVLHICRHLICRAMFENVKAYDIENPK